MPTTAGDILKRIKDEEIEWIDLRFTDPKGKWQHLTMVASIMGEDEFTDGLMFDGSSIEGWKAINESDMTLMPDPATACMDPFYSAATMSIVCDILEPATGEPYGRDPRANLRRRLRASPWGGSRRHIRRRDTVRCGLSGARSPWPRSP